MNKNLSFNNCFIGFFLYNLVFWAWQQLYSLLHNSSFTGSIALPATVYFDLITAGIFQLALYALLTLIQTIILWEVSREHSTQIMEKRQAWLFLLTITALLLVNCYFFPLSQFSHFFLPAIPIKIITFFAAFTTLIIVSLFGLAMFRLVLRRPLILLFLLPAVMIIVGYLNPKNKQPFIALENSNIIIIGIDSLSAEQVTPQLTPNLYHFLHTSVHFKETISPLARTYPAWTSILTGMYPLHHHARENLISPTRIRTDLSFAWTLKKLGYTTIFATDDRRFNNLDQAYGFDEIIGPKLGIEEILLGSFYDFPLSNILINLPFSRWLLPYNYSNRAGHFSYYPSTFDHFLQNRLSQQQPDKPLFLAVHFTLPHWPYAWASTQPKEIGNEFDVENKENLYKKSVFAADQQLGVLLHYLKERGALKNCMLIMLSDHGEVMYKKGSRQLDPELYQGTKNILIDYFTHNTSTAPEKSTGHGSDLLSPGQFHSVLGFAIYKNGNLATSPKSITQRVSLIDIAPTVLAFLHQPIPTQVDGLSLLDNLLYQLKPPAGRAFMLESGMLPNQILTRKSALQYGKLFFRVNPTNERLEINPAAMDYINANKLYGILQGNWILVLYPDRLNYIPVILRLNDGKWSDDPDALFTKKSPMANMLRQLRSFYKNDLATYPYTRLILPAPQKVVQ